VIPGFRRGVNEICIFWDFTQRIMDAPNSSSRKLEEIA